MLDFNALDTISLGTLFKAFILTSTAVVWSSGIYLTIVGYVISLNSELW